MATKLELAGHEFEVTDRIQEYVEKKVAKFERYLNTIEEIHIDLSHIKSARSASDRYVTQMTVRGKGLLLRVEERADDIRKSVDDAVDKMSRQIARFKGKRHQGRGDGKSAAEVAIEIEPMPELEAEEAPVIMRRKRFDIIPMTEEEAIEQMKLLGHDNFFIFYNAKASAVNVLYRRRDGTYGLIEPYVR
jgi:putative sigma-54 modulation protein